MEERMGSRRQGSRHRIVPEAAATFHISVVWLVFYVVLLGHGITSHKAATTSVGAAGQASLLLSADRKEPASAVRGQ